MLKNVVVVVTVVVYPFLANAQEDFDLFFDSDYDSDDDTDSDEEENEEEGQPSDGSVDWFSELGIALTGGVTLQEEAVGTGLFVGFGIGTNVLLGFFRKDIHRLCLDLGYLYYTRERSGGTTQLVLRTQYNRVAAALGYNILPKFFIIGAKLGAAFAIVTTHSEYREISYVVENNSTHFVVESVLDSRHTTGISPGFYAGISFGIDLGDLIWDRDKNLFEIRIVGDYLVRKTRDEFMAGLMLVFWPSGFSS